MTEDEDIQRIDHIKISRKQYTEDPVKKYFAFLDKLQDPGWYTGLLYQVSYVNTTDGVIKGGGFQQYLLDYLPFDDPEEVLEAYKVVGAPNQGIVLKSAINQYKVYQAEKNGNEETAFDKMHKIINELESKYYQLPDIQDVLMAFLKKREKELIEWID